MTLVHVIVDTTELVKVPLLDAAGWRQLLARSRRGHIRLLIPEVVLLEAERRFQARITGDVAQAQRALEKLRQLGVSDTPNLETTVSQGEELGDSYRTNIQSRLLAYGGSVLPLPSVSHSELLQRDLAVRKPFRSNGKGYRDALIWESLREYIGGCESGSTVYFVTDNTDDYCDQGSGQLARVLREEAAAIAPSSNIVRVSRVTEVIEALREEFDERDLEDEMVDEAFAEPTLDEIIGRAVIDASERLIGASVADLRDREHRQLDVLLFDDVTPPEATHIQTVSINPEWQSIDFSIYDQYEGNTLAINASVEAQVEFEAYVDRPYSSRFIERDVDDDDDDYSVPVTFSRDVRLWFDLVIVGLDIASVNFDYAEAA